MGVNDSSREEWTCERGGDVRQEREDGRGEERIKKVEYGLETAEVESRKLKEKSERRGKRREVFVEFAA